MNPAIAAAHELWVSVYLSLIQFLTLGILYFFHNVVEPISIAVPVFVISFCYSVYHDETKFGHNTSIFSYLARVITNATLVILSAITLTSICDAIPHEEVYGEQTGDKFEVGMKVPIVQCKYGYYGVLAGGILMVYFLVTVCRALMTFVVFFYQLLKTWCFGGDQQECVEQQNPGTSDGSAAAGEPKS